MLYQSEAAQRYKPVAQTLQAGVATINIFEFSFTEQVNTTDVIEMGSLGSNSVITDLVLIGENISNGCTAEVGLLDGLVFNKDNGRDIDTVISPAVDIDDTETAVSKAECLALAATDKTRGLGLKLSVNQTILTGKITMIVTSVQRAPT